MRHRCTIIAALILAGTLTALPHILRGQASYSGEPRTIAHEFLDMEKDLGAGMEHHAALNALIGRAMTAIVPEKGGSTEEAVKTLKQIDEFLKKEGFVYRQNFLLSRGIASKGIDCDNYCALYTAIAEVMGIPIVPVYAPNHSFLRFYFPDGSYLNWEPTQGIPRPDSYYRETLNIHEVSVKNGVYLKTLTRKEFLAVEYNNMGAHLMTEKQFAPAIVCFSRAIELYPAFSSAWHNRGSSFYGAGRAQEALSDLEKARSLDPNRASTHNTLGDIYMDGSRYEDALREYTASIKLDPGNYIPYNNIAVVMQKLGRKDKAAQWLRKSKEVQSRQSKGVPGVR